jgi:hypothetical protein
MMTANTSAAELFDRLKRKAPEYLDLITADTEEEFEKAFTPLMERAVKHLEQNKVNYASLDEEGLSAALAGKLSMPGLTVTQETNSNGHVDLTIEADHCTPARTKLGEAKIYDGPAYHIYGIGQLLGRYTTGRETPGLLINYVRDKDIRGITEKLRTRMDAERPANQIGPCEPHTLKWSLRTKHKHNSGEALSVSHIACNMHVDPTGLASSTPGSARRRA